LLFYIKAMAGFGNYSFLNCDRVMDLRIFIDSNDSFLNDKYVSAVLGHNAQMYNSDHPDAGVDLFTPFETQCMGGDVTKINFSVKCSARMICENGKTYNTGFFMMPRSSLSGTPLRLANSVGVIDSGYRGNLMGKFDCLAGVDGDYFVSRYDKLLQIVAPGMVPIYVTIVNNTNDLGDNTERGSGGFGSTGR
jgi:dUTP pyrophosphatase